MKEEEPDHINEEPDARDGEEGPSRVDFFRLKHPIDTLAEHIESREYQEEAIEKARKGLYPGETVSVISVLRQLRDVGGYESDQEPEAVEEHMEGVCYEAKTV